MLLSEERQEVRRVVEEPGRFNASPQFSSYCLASKSNSDIL